MGQIKIYLLIGLTGFKMDRPILKWAAGFKTGQILNRAVTDISAVNVCDIKLATTILPKCTYRFIV